MFKRASKVLRKRKHLTQSELSECIDYTNERQLQRIERGGNGLFSWQIDGSGTGFRDWYGFSIVWN